ncbi:MAG: enoyl-CoA hydratase [Alphaproteobacteria bacterium]|nr:enoyl-CoA hydratase [Alphaproteobacteria bacterium]
MTMERILLRRDQQGVAHLTLNRPQARNALSLALIDALQSELDAIAQDRSVRVVVIGANGPAFSAGHDLKEVSAAPSREAYQDLFDRCSKLMLSVVRLPQPVIARVHAMATAAGCQLVASCDLAIAANTAQFATPGVNIGLFCSTPMVALSRAIPRKRAMEMLLTGTPVSADQALALGLINQAVPEDKLDEAVNELALTIAAKSASTLAIGKEAFYRQAEMDYNAAYAYAGQVMVKNLETKDACEGIEAFLGKRPPVWQDE